MSSIGDYGQKLDLNIRQGGTFGPFAVTITNPDNTPVNLTGYTFRGQIRKKPKDTAIVAEFSCVITNPTAGIFTFTIPATITSTIPAGDTINSSDSKYIYDLEMVDNTSKVIPLIYGNAIVLREVTR